MSEERESKKLMIAEEIQFLRGLSRPKRNAGYGDLAKVANAKYREGKGLDEIEDEMTEEGYSVSFSILLDLIGVTDYYEFVVDKEDD